jgi:tRNA splicing ligase
MDSIIIIPKGNSSDDIKEREKIIRHFYRRWKEENPSQRRYNLSLKEYINIRMVSIIETSEHAAKSYLSTLAVLQLDAILVGAKKVYISKTKKNNKNQEPFERMMIMEYELIGIGKVKMTVGIRRRTKEKVQYCITAIFWYIIKKASH